MDLLSNAKISTSRAYITHNNPIITLTSVALLVLALEQTARGVQASLDSLSEQSFFFNSFLAFFYIVARLS
jgi:hypothetical protein